MIQAATVAWVIAADERFLFVEEAIGGTATLNQPAGHWEPGETLIEAACRELQEETSLQLPPQGLVGIYRLSLPHKTFWRHVFWATLDSPLPCQPQDPDFLACHWLSATQLRHWHQRSPLVAKAIDDYQQGCRYPLSVLQHA